MVVEKEENLFISTPQERERAAVKKESEVRTRWVYYFYRSYELNTTSPLIILADVFQEHSLLLLLHKFKTTSQSAS